MKQWIYDKGTVIGSFEAEARGLYWEFSCEIDAGENTIRRLYAVCGYASHYLGIPDARGRLCKRLPRTLLPDGASCLVSSTREKGKWLPWRGMVDGVAVEDGCFCPDESGVTLSLSPEDALQFPAWADAFCEQKEQDQTRMLVQLTVDWKLPAQKIENRRDKDEKDENSVGTVDPLLPYDSDPCAGLCAGGEVQGREADRPDL